LVQEELAVLLQIPMEHLEVIHYFHLLLPLVVVMVVLIIVKVVGTVVQAEAQAEAPRLPLAALETLLPQYLVKGTMVDRYLERIKMGPGAVVPEHKAHQQAAGAVV